MAIINILNGVFGQGREVAEALARRLDLPLLDDDLLLDETSKRFDLSRERLAQKFREGPCRASFLPREKERCACYAKLVMADFLEQGRLVYIGLVSLMVPRTIYHTLNVCLIANRPYRLNLAGKPQLSEKETLNIIRKEDELAAAFAQRYQNNSPWAQELYDILIPMNQSDVDVAVELIVNHTGKDILAPTPRSLQAVHDFRLTAEIELVLSEKGYSPADIKTGVWRNKAVLEINKKHLRLKRLEEALKRLALGVAGIEAVDIKIGPHFHKAHVVRKADFSLPADALLFSDEKEFFQTLSGRLQARDLGAPIAYDGEQALQVVENENPDIIVMDIRMPDITGIDILNLLKNKKPELEVIIITGHGSDKERKKCLDLGAFAYFNKPVDIESLSRAISGAQHQAQHREKTSR